MRRVRLSLGALAVFALVASAVLCVKSRDVYGTPAFWGMPARINYCERRYYPSPHDVRGTPPEARPVTSSEVWKVVGRTYTRRPIYAAVNLDPDRSVCTMALFVRTGAHQYRSFGLSGGP